MPNNIHVSTWGRFVIDETTGFPILGEGLFWRVTRGFLSPYIDVQLRRKMWYGSRKIHSHPVDKDRATQGKILDAAEYVLWEKPVSKDWKKFVGTYPPKKLES